MPQVLSDAGTKGRWELVAQRGNFAHRGRLDEKSDAYALGFLILKGAPVGTTVTLRHHGLLRTRREIEMVKVSENEIAIDGYRDDYTLNEVPASGQYEQWLQPLLIKLKWADMSGFPAQPNDFPFLEKVEPRTIGLGLGGIYKEFERFDYFQSLWDTPWPAKLGVLLWSPVYAFQLTVAMVVLAAGLPFLAIEGLRKRQESGPATPNPMGESARAWTHRLATGARLVGETVVLDGSFLLLLKSSSRTVQSAVVMGTALSLLVAGKLVTKLTKERTENQVGVE